MSTPISVDFKKGYLAFQKREKRDSMYRTATFLVDHFWGKSAEIADSLGVLLLTWNHAFYRYGIFDFDKLEDCISKNLPLLDKYRNSSISNYTSADDKAIEHLFQHFLNALRINDGKKKGQKSPVAVAKALHLLAPDFFPLWDYKIAQAYGCAYSSNPAEKYLVFFRKSKDMAERLQSSLNPKAMGKTLLKLIDEYNYAKYTRGWI
ncbi:MAG TPA: hypothetical protein VF553_22160 [Pyrinomonadaceae bacterium]